MNQTSVRATVTIAQEHLLLETSRQPQKTTIKMLESTIM
jgi:hypothetical protein